MGKVWYKYKFFWRRGDKDGDESPQDRGDGTGDLIFNTMTKIVFDKDINNVTIKMTMPADEKDDYTPWTASVILSPVSNSDITVSRQKINLIKKILAYKIDRLTQNNIRIIDDKGNVISDF